MYGVSTTWQVSRQMLGIDPKTGEVEKNEQKEVVDEWCFSPHLNHKTNRKRDKSMGTCNMEYIVSYKSQVLADLREQYLFQSVAVMDR